MVVAKISTSRAPTNVAFPPSPIYLLTAFNNTGFHTNTATAHLPASHEVLVKTILIQADLIWSPLPLVPLCIVQFSSISFILKSDWGPDP